MAATEAPPLFGDDLTDAVTASMVALHERYHHRVPAQAKSRMMGDEMLACVMGGVYTDVEKTLIEVQRAPLVRDARDAFQDVMSRRIVAEVERLSGRRVAFFVSKNHIGPDVQVELFMLDAAPGVSQAVEGGS